MKICVIGAGLAGGIVASQLSKHNFQVTLIEQGTKPLPYESDNEVWENNRHKAIFTRGMGIGGTSNFWHGGLTILDETDVEGRTINSNYAKLPIRYAELRNYYNKAINIIRGADKYSLIDIESPPTSERNEFVLNTDYFRYKGILYPTKPFCTTKEIEKAKKDLGLSVIENFEVKKINITKSHAISVEGFDYSNSIIKKIKADVFILCAGGFGSPKILLESMKDSQILKALPIGKNVIDHPSGFVFKAKLRCRMKLKSLFGETGKGYRIQHGFALNPQKLGISNNRNHIIFLRPATSMKDPLLYDFLKRKLVGYKGNKMTFSDVLYLFKHTDLLFDAINFKYGMFNSTKYVSGLTFLEQFPNEQYSITFNKNSKYSIKWDVSEDDSQSAIKFLKTFFESHKDIFEHYIVFPEISNRLVPSGHHSGGCRMASDPAKGVVDSNLRVFGTDNLFVVDGSVIGYSGHANTGLTISALALKCADVIKST